VQQGRAAPPVPARSTGFGFVPTPVESFWQAINPTRKTSLRTSPPPAPFETPPEKGGSSGRAVGSLFLRSFSPLTLRRRPLLSRRNPFAPCRRVLRAPSRSVPAWMRLYVQGPSGQSEGATRMCARPSKMSLPKFVIASVERPFWRFQIPRNPPHACHRTIGTRWHTACFNRKAGQR